MARPIIAQCRREIGIGWQHVEAARAVMRRSEWLLARWKDSERLLAEISIVPAQDMFIPVAPATVNALRRKRPGRNRRRLRTAV
jgi:hypothetical protein